MKHTLTKYEVANLLWRDKENNGYTYDACKALAEHLEEMEEAMGEEMEIDVVAIRCDWTEYASLSKAYAEHTGKDEPDFGDDEHEEKKHTDYVARYFEERTSVVIFDVNNYPNPNTKRVLIRQF